MLVKFAKEAYNIAAGEALSGKIAAPQAIKVATGRVWLTVEGSNSDYWLHAGESFTLPAGRLIVIEADKGASRIEKVVNRSKTAPVTNGAGQRLGITNLNACKVRYA